MTGMSETFDQIIGWLRRWIVGAATAGILLGGQTGAATAQSAREVVLTVTPSLARSGLLGQLVPKFEKRYRMTVKIVEQADVEGALGLAGSGGTDLLWLNDEMRERASIKAGLTIARRDVMFGELVLIGPKSDPAGVMGMTSLVDAARLIAVAEARFVSRGDGSAVTRIERGVWSELGINLPAPGKEKWYIVQQGGMRKTLETALEKNAYTLSDRASWLGFDEAKDHVVLVTSDPRMILQFSALLVNPKRQKTVNAAGARAFLNWLTSKKTQKTINEFSISGKFPYTANFGQRKTE
jgi:tungstate transport system substrate-binding protein